MAPQGSQVAKESRWGFPDSFLHRVGAMPSTHLSAAQRSLDERKHFKLGLFCFSFLFPIRTKRMPRDIVHGKGAAIERVLKDKTPIRGV